MAQGLLSKSRAFRRAQNLGHCWASVTIHGPGLQEARMASRECSDNTAYAMWMDHNYRVALDFFSQCCGLGTFLHILGLEDGRRGHGLSFLLCWLSLSSVKTQEMLQRMHHVGSPALALKSCLTRGGSVEAALSGWSLQPPARRRHPGRAMPRTCVPGHVPLQGWQRRLGSVSHAPWGLLVGQLMCGCKSVRS